MKKSIVLLSLGLAVLAHAEDYSESGLYDYVPDLVTKQVLGYTVDCFSGGDYHYRNYAHEYNLPTKNTHKPFDFCKPANTNLVLNHAKNMTDYNFGGDLKLVVVKPLVNGKPQNNYQLIAIVDEIDKKIHVAPLMYTTGDYLGTDHEWERAPTPVIYSDKNSFMFCPKDDAHYTHGGTVYFDSGCMVYFGESSDFAKFSRFDDREYHVLKHKGIRIEQTDEYKINHRTYQRLRNYYRNK